MGEEPPHSSVPDADKGPPLQEMSRVEGTEDAVGGGAEGNWEVEELVHDPGSPAGKRCSQAVLDFLSTTDVGRLVSAEEDMGSKVSEWKRREREEERRAEAEEFEGRRGTTPLFLLTPSFTASACDQE